MNPDSIVNRIGSVQKMGLWLANIYINYMYPRVDEVVTAGVADPSKTSGMSLERLLKMNELGVSRMTSTSIDVCMMASSITYENEPGRPGRVQDLRP